jgi:hypothetical protein
MTKQTKMILGGVAVLGLAYFLLKGKKGMANMSGMANFGGMDDSDNFANAQGRRLCVRTNPNGSTTSYTPLGGGRCSYGGTLQNV